MTQYPDPQNEVGRDDEPSEAGIAQFAAFSTDESGAPDDSDDEPSEAGIAQFAAFSTDESGAPDDSTDLKFGKDIATITSSYGPDSPEVIEMAEAFEKGVPIVLYEFMQGMVDYGRNYDPPPRIIITRQDGTREIFNGNVDTGNEENPITSLEFYNNGPGLSPEDTVIIRHDGKGVSELGTHGRGTTVSLAFLASKGMPVSISSNHCGTDWKLTSSLVPTEAKTTSVLGVKGKWGYPNPNPRTCFKIDNPSQEICEMLAKVGDYFLYANPRSSKALLVDKSEDQFEEESVKIDEGEATCIEGAIPEIKGLHPDIFVDGLRLPLRHRVTALPWSVAGFSDNNPDNRYYRYRVGRSHDSSSVDSESNLENIIPLAVRKLKNRKFLEKIIETSLAKEDYRHLYETVDTEEPFEEGTKAVIQAIWREKYDGALIEDKARNVEKFKRLHGEEQKIVLMSKELYLFLAKAGVMTVSAKLGVENSVSFDRLNTLNVPSAMANDSLQIMMRGIVMHGGNVDTVKVKGKKKLRISFPEVVKESEEFNGTTESSTGTFLRIMSVILGVKEIDCEMFCKEKDYLHELKITPSKSNWGKENSYETDIEIHTYNDKQFPEFIRYENGFTYILIDAESLNMEEENLMDRLIAYFQKLSKKFQSRIDRYKLKAPPKKKIEAVPKAPKAGNGVGQIATKNTLHPNNDPKAAREKGHSKEKSDWPVGYYQSSVGSEFIFEELGGRTAWVNDEGWEREEVPQNAPFRYSSKTVLYNLANCSAQRLEVLKGHKIAGMKTIPQNAAIQIFREKRTGTYCITGTAEQVIYYTKLDKKSDYSRIPPLAVEKEDVLADKSLLIPEWREFINYVNSNAALTVEAKLKLLIKQWRGKFVYSDRYGLDDQGQGPSKEVVAAKIVNTSKGICNTSASGFAILLRAIGIPSRVCGGYWEQGNGHGGQHLWVEYWDNHQWVQIESQIGTAQEAKDEEVDLRQSLIGTLRENRGTAIALLQVAAFAAVLTAVGVYTVNKLGGPEAVSQKISALIAEIIPDSHRAKAPDPETETTPRANEGDDKSFLCNLFCE
jgi:transglutaminase-like putative cysteine protease